MFLGYDKGMLLGYDMRNCFLAMTWEMLLGYDKGMLLGYDMRNCSLAMTRGNVPWL